MNSSELTRVGTRQMNQGGGGWEGGRATFLITKLGLQRTKCSWRISLVYDERGNNPSRAALSSNPFINLNVTIKRGSSRGGRETPLCLHATINSENWGWTSRLDSALLALVSLSRTKRDRNNVRWVILGNRKQKKIFMTLNVCYFSQWTFLMTVKIIWRGVFEGR